MKPIEAAILRTVLYADVFNFPLTPAEIHHFLIDDRPATPVEVTAALEQAPLLRRALCYERGYIVLAGREALIPLRIARDSASQVLWPLALRYGVWLARLPFVRMVALTGALAMRNATDHQDDLDYMLVTAARRVWLARAFSIILVRLARLNGVEICPNYVVAENNLEQDQQNIFIAHEVAQMVPLHGHHLYQRLRACNPWVSGYLPNATSAFYAEHECPIGWGWRLLKTALEMLLSGRLGDALEQWEYRRKLRRFTPEIAGAFHHAARVDDTQIKGHFNDHGQRVLQQYAERLRQHHLAETASPLSAD